MTVEELYGRVWLEKARKEGHRPMHLVTQPVDHQANGKAKRGPLGVTAAKVRELHAQGLTLKEAAEALGLASMTVYRSAKRQGLKFHDGRAA
jgi:DNA invertase Pin-like site-specific DNA recombinase